MTLAVDFDGVIHDHKHPVEGKRMGAPFEDAQLGMRRLLARKHKLIIHTVMATTPGGQKVVEDWLAYYKIKHHGVTAIKPNADIYIDDRAYHHTNWTDTFQFVKGYKP